MDITPNTSGNKRQRSESPEGSRREGDQSPRRGSLPPSKRFRPRGSVTPEASGLSPALAAASRASAAILGEGQVAAQQERGEQGLPLQQDNPFPTNDDSSEIVLDPLTKARLARRVGRATEEQMELIRSARLAAAEQMELIKRNEEAIRREEEIPPSREPVADPSQDLGITHPYEAEETTKTIEKIRQLNPHELRIVRFLLSQDKYINHLSDDARRHAKDIYKDILTLAQYCDSNAHTINDKEASEAYNRLKAKYNEGDTNDKVREWHKRIGCDYAQDAQAAGSSQQVDTHSGPPPEATSTSDKGKQDLGDFLKRKILSNVGTKDAKSLCNVLYEISDQTMHKKINQDMKDKAGELASYASKIYDFLNRDDYQRAKDVEVEEAAKKLYKGLPLMLNVTKNTAISKFRENLGNLDRYYPELSEMHPSQQSSYLEVHPRQGETSGSYPQDTSSAAGTSRASDSRWINPRILESQAREALDKNAIDEAKNYAQGQYEHAINNNRNIAQYGQIFYDLNTLYTFTQSSNINSRQVKDAMRRIEKYNEGTPGYNSRKIQEVVTMIKDNLDIQAYLSSPE